MSLTFIDNQPIRFNSSKFDDQACINKDLSAYSMLVQPGDHVHFQAKLSPCGDDLKCDAIEEGAEQITDGDMSNPAAFTLGTGWSIAGGVATWDATAGFGILTQTGIGVSAGKQQVLRINIVSNTTGEDILIFVGNRIFKIIESSFTGVAEVYNVSGSLDRIDIATRTDYALVDTGSFVIDDLSLKEVAQCYTFDTFTREYVLNGTFTGNANFWSLGTGWAYNANNVLHTAGNTGNFFQEILNLAYRHDFQLTINVGGTVGSIDYRFGGNPASGPSYLLQNIAAGAGLVSINEPLMTLYGAVLSVTPTSNFNGTIDDISVEQTQNGWSYDSIRFNHEPGWSNPFYAGSTLSIGRYYELIVRIIADEGSVTIEGGGNNLGTFTNTQTYKLYFTSTSTSGEKFTPSADFDGSVEIVSLYELGTMEARLVYEDGITGATDWHTKTSSSNAIFIEKDYAMWRITSLAAIFSGGVPVGLSYSCYRMQVRSICEAEDITVTYTSDTIINYKASHPCTKLFMAYCDGDAFDFRFGDEGDRFRLYMRLRMLYFNPSYPSDEPVDYEFSSGFTQRIFAKSQKKYEGLFDYADEYMHDCLRLMLLCDWLYIDNTRYLADAKDYEPAWAERGKRNLAQSTIEFQKAQGVLFNRNCS